MSGSGQTRPFEQIPAMSGYPPKDSEYDSYLEPPKRRPPTGPIRLPSAAKPLRAASGQIAFGFFDFFLVQNLQRAGRNLTTAVPETFRWSMVEGRRVRGWVVAVATLLNDTAHQDR